MTFVNIVVQTASLRKTRNARFDGS